MPHAAGGRSDDFASDEIKVFKHEGEEEEEKKTSSENLTDLKSSLVTEGEENSSLPGQSYAIKAESSRPDSTPLLDKTFGHIHRPSPFGYVVSSYPHPHPNGALGSVSMANKVAMVPPPHPGSPIPLMMYNHEGFTPPPAHMGIQPVHLASKTGIPRPPMYSITATGQYPHPSMFSSEFAQQFQWHSSMYPMAPAGFRGPYPGGLPVTTSSIHRFNPPSILTSHPGIPPHPGFHHSVLLTTPPKLEIPFHEHHSHSLSAVREEQRNQSNKMSETSPRSNGGNTSKSNDKKAPHIKKPLNAFMLYMKEMRAKVVAECTLKESAAINQILGRRWHGLSREEQAKYYEMARKERQVHMQMYPGWSARDNYALNNKRKKRKKDKAQDGGNVPKKCRARFGLEQQSSWCKPCRRKKKCIRYVSGAENIDCDEDPGSIEAPTPESRISTDSEQDNLNISSELSMSSPPVPNNSDSDLKLILSDSDAHMPRNHPLSVHLLTQPHNLESCDNDSVPIPQLPTPPSTDSSTAAAPPLLTVT